MWRAAANCTKRSVLKKRLSDFEKFVRRLEITRYGVKVGEPFSHRGVLSGAVANGAATPED